MKTIGVLTYELEYTLVQAERKFDLDVLAAESEKGLRQEHSENLDQLYQM